MNTIRLSGTKVKICIGDSGIFGEDFCPDPPKPEGILKTLGVPRHWAKIGAI